MARFALIKNGIVTNLVHAESAFVDYQINSGAIDSGVELMAGVNPNVGDAYAGGVFSAPIPPLAVARSRKLSEFSTAVSVYVSEMHPLETRIQLMNVYTLSKFQGLTNRADYLEGALEWTNSLIGYAATFAAAVQGATVASVVSAMTWDIAANTAPDPQIKLSEAIQIPD